MSKRVCIIGGGPGGMMAAIAAASAGARVTVLEKNAAVGRKLLATGNGRCNYTNRDLALEHFHGANSPFISTALAQFDGPHTVDFFRALGVEPYCDERGRYFPASQEAAAVLLALTQEMEHLGVEVITHSEIVGVTKVGRGPHSHIPRPMTENGDSPQRQGVQSPFSFAVRERGKVYEADEVIVACGGRAGPQFGSGGSGHNIAQAFGHKIVPVRAALAPIELMGPWFHKLQGVRMEASLTIAREKTILTRIADEVLFANYGISGPLALRASRMIGEGNCEVEMSFLPALGGDGKTGTRHGGQAVRNEGDTPDFSAALAIVKSRASSLRHRTAGDFLTGLLPAKVGCVMAGQSGIAPETPCAKLTGSQLRGLARNLTHWPIQAKGLRPFKDAQVTVGGVATPEINAATMESKLVACLFFCGEVMDVDGDSGGYNLQWAWTSGFIAGRSAGSAVRS
jgi:hypothetical protein